MHWEFDQAELEKGAALILNELIPYRIWLLRGRMGSGKTTLVRKFAKILGDQNEASSPSYSLINEYRFKSNKYKIQKLFHLDLFRLNNLDEALDIGIEEILFTNFHCIIEWPDIILPLLAEQSFAELTIDLFPGEKRKYSLNIQDA